MFNWASIPEGMWVRSSFLKNCERMWISRQTRKYDRDDKKTRYVAKCLPTYTEYESKIRITPVFKGIYPIFKPTQKQNVCGRAMLESTSRNDGFLFSKTLFLPDRKEHIFRHILEICTLWWPRSLVRVFSCIHFLCRLMSQFPLPSSVCCKCNRKLWVHFSCDQHYALEA